MSSAEFEPAIPVIKRLQTYTLDRTATSIVGYCKEWSVTLRRTLVKIRRLSQRKNCLLVVLTVIMVVHIWTSRRAAHWCTGLRNYRKQSKDKGRA